jgi:hypothetical protein
MPYNPPANNTQSGNGENLYALANSGGSGGVSSLNSLSGALNLTSTGNTVTITEVGQSINLETAPVIPNGSAGINGTGGSIPINTVTTPVLTLSFAAGSTPVNVNATAYLLFHNSSLTAATYSIYFYEGATNLLWGVVDVPAGAFFPVCLTKYFSAVSGTVNINLLCRLSGGTSDPAQTYTNPSITAVWN